MKTTKKVLVLLLATVMLLLCIPFNAFAATTYTVTLKCGPEGTGSTVTLYKTAGTNLQLSSNNSDIKNNYGMAPSTGGSGFGAQRVFIEWNTSVNSNGKGVGNAYRDWYTVDRDVTLYAVWGFEIQYNADGGTFPATGNDVFLKYVADCDDNNYQNPKTLYGNFDFPEGSNAPTKEGCRRVTMSNGNDFFGLLYPDMSFFTTETSAQNLTIPPTGGKMPWSSFHCATTAHGNPAPEFYAIWEPSVTYHPNGGSGSAYSEYLDWDWGPVHYYNSYYVDSNSFSKSGTSFVGWNTMPDGSGTSYAVGANLGGQRSNSDPITLYAQWADGSTGVVVPATKYTLTFDTNGGSMMAGKTYEIEYGQTYSEAIGINIPTPYRDGYTFAGWYCEKYGYTLNVNDQFGAKEDVTFVAQWVSNEPAVPTYNLTFNANGGVMPSGYSSTYVFKDDELLSSVIGGFPVPTKTGYIFDGWMLSGSSAVWTDSFGAQTFTYGTNVSLLALWSVDPDYVAPPVAYTISFNANGGAISGTTSYSIYNGQTYSEVISSTPLIVRDGYDHIGWYCSAYDYTLDLNDTFNFENNVTFIALWEKVDEAGTYTLTLNPNGGIMPEGYSTTYTFKADEKFVDVIGGYPVPTRQGYTFNGWLRDDWPLDHHWIDDWGTQPYTFGHDVTLSAQWIECSHSYANTGSLAATCTTDGYIAYTCSKCGTVKKDTISSLGHSYGDWVVYKEATAQPGEERRYCNNGCGLYESREIPAIVIVAAPALTVTDMIVSITNADNISEIAYASGSYTTYEAIENADDCTFIGSGYITSNSTNGVFNITLSNTGTYTFYVLMSDGRSYFLTAVVEEEAVEPIPEAYLSVDGVIITAHELYDVRDMFIAKGVYSTYQLVNSNKIVRITSAKIGDATEYSYNVNGGGNYTVCIRYNDGNIVFLYTTIEVADPTFTTNGLQLTIGNLEGIKVVRTALGEHANVSSIKKAEGARAFTAKYITDKSAYMVQYRATGTYTVAVCYENGYTVIVNVDIVMKTPTFEQEGNTVTFGNLDGLKVARYVMGEYTTSSQIKKAPGSVALTASKVVDGKLTVTLKSSGIYSFCVQYDDESYNYYTVVVE